MPGPLQLPENGSRGRSAPLLATVAVLWLLLWTLIGLTETAPLIHARGVPLWHPIAIVMISTAVLGAWLTWALLTRRFERVPLDPPRQWFLYHLRVVPLLIVGEIALVAGLRQLAYGAWAMPYKYLPWRIFIPYESTKVVLFYVLWLALMFGILTLARWREDSERMLGVQKALAEAQLAQLQAQLRPHFLFNALNTVSSLMMTDTARADRMLAQLGDLLRASLAAGRPGPVPLRDELKVLEKYADIMQERFEGRAVLEWEVADDALDVRVPPMLLQPLLENAFKHGVERNTQPVRICIRAARIEDTLRVEIYNSGSSVKANGADGAATASRGAAGSGTALADARANGADDACVGLRNCRERLRLLYGPAAELVIANDPAGGVLASVKVPCQAQAS